MVRSSNPWIKVTCHFDTKIEDTLKDILSQIKVIIGKTILWLRLNIESKDQARLDLKSMTNVLIQSEYITVEIQINN